jgi:hypothetical protein
VFLLFPSIRFSGKDLGPVSKYAIILIAFTISDVNLKSVALYFYAER